ncbi:MAG: hypothetical protein H0W70_15480, partial [Actinobacteria bacterium]|nr:hypothetical protein [Actinomycetota bacterium]
VPPADLAAIADSLDANELSYTADDVAEIFDVPVAVATTAMTELL